ncbi:hypothetical protein TNCV_3528081 [Trichonephila clavipes]|nr:hypothetical protein TNCV_3528081 [Trichonephila clavipes]
MMEYFRHAEEADMHYMYNSANEGWYTARNTLGEFDSPELVSKRLHRQLHETVSFYVPRHDASRRRAIRRPPSLKKNILNVVADRPE